DRKGTKLRSVALDFAMSSPGIAQGNIFYVGGNFTGGSRFVAIDLDKPFLWVKWAFVTGSQVSAAPAIHQNSLFIGSEAGRVYAINEQRNPIWPLGVQGFATAGRILADVKADDFGVYVASTDSKLYCLDRATGGIKWQYYAQHALENSPIVTPTTVYQIVP